MLHLLLPSGLNVVAECYEGSEPSVGARRHGVARLSSNRKEIAKEGYCSSQQQDFSRSFSIEKSSILHPTNQIMFLLVARFQFFSRRLKAAESRQSNT